MAKRKASAAQVAKALNISTARIRQLVREGMPRDGRNGYNLKLCTQWYEQRAKASSRRAQSQSEQLVSHQRARQLKAQADKIELKLAIDRRELIHLAEAERTYGELIDAARIRLLNVPARIASHLEGEDRLTIQSKLDEAIREALTVLSGGPDGHPQQHHQQRDAQQPAVAVAAAS